MEFPHKRFGQPTQLQAFNPLDHFKIGFLRHIEKCGDSFDNQKIIVLCLHMGTHHIATTTTVPADSTLTAAAMICLGPRHSRDSTTTLLKLMKWNSFPQLQNYPSSTGHWHSYQPTHLNKLTSPREHMIRHHSEFDASNEKKANIQKNNNTQFNYCL